MHVCAKQSSFSEAPSSSGMLDSCVSATVRLPLSPLCPPLARVCFCVTWSQKAPICTHLCIHVHMWDSHTHTHTRTHTHTHTHTNRLQRHIEFSCTDTQAPASPPPTTSMLTAQTVTLKTQSQRRHIDIRPVPVLGIIPLLWQESRRVVVFLKSLLCYLVENLATVS